MVPSRFSSVSDDGSSGTLRSVIRLQDVYSKTNFPPQEVNVVGVAFRPAPGTSPFSAAGALLSVVMSTTPRDPSQLSYAFAENYGADTLQVFSGPITLSSLATGPANGPKAFDIMIPFDRPFRYDPAKGNLLVEFAGPGITGAGITEASNENDDGAGRAFTLSGYKETRAQYVDSGADVLQILVDTKPFLGVTPAPGDYPEDILVTLFNSFADSVLTVTTDGSEPTLASSFYTGSIPVTTNTVVQARVFTNGVPATDVLRAEYTITIPRPTVRSSTADFSVTDGERADFSVMVSGVGPMAYQWFHGSTELVGETGETLTIGAVNRESAGDYFARITNRGGSVFSPATVLTVVGIPPEITGQPDSVLTTPGSAASFRVVARGSQPLVYIWQKNGTPIVTNDTGVLSFTSAQAEDVGTYSVVVTNWGGTATSMGAYLAFLVDGQPLPGAILPARFATHEDNGSAGTLRASIRIQEVYQASQIGTSPMFLAGISFRPESKSIPFTNVISSLRLVLSTTTNAPDGLSSVFASNTGPDSMVVYSGSIEIASKVTGPSTGPCAFDIYIPFQRIFLYDPSKGNLLVDLSSTGGDGVSAVDASDDVDDGASRVFSLSGPGSATGNVDSGADVIQLIPVASAGVTFWPTATEFANPFELVLFTSRPGAVIAYTLDGSDPGLDSPKYSAPITVSASVQVKARLYVEGLPVGDVLRADYVYKPVAPTITAQPVSKSVVEGGSVTFSVTASGSNPMAYQWLSGTTELPGQTNASITLSPLTLAQSGEYRVRVSNAVDAVLSSAATLTVTRKPVAPAITLPLVSQSVQVGGTAVFTVEASGTDPLTYIWYRGASSVQIGTNNVLKMTNIAKTKAGTYTVRINNAAGSVTSDPAVLTVTDAPVVPVLVASPASVTLSPGAALRRSASFSGAGLSYVWTRNGVPIVAGTNTVLEVAHVTLADAGTYTVTASNTAGAVTSKPAVVLVDDGVAGGSVILANRDAGSSLDAPVFDFDGVTRLSGPGYLGQLYAGATAESLAPIGPAVPFLTGANAGYLSSSPSAVRVIPSVAPGGTAFVQVRYWDASQGAGASFEAALASGGKTGQSAVLQIQTGGAGEPPSFPPYLQALQSVTIRAETVLPVVQITSPVNDSGLEFTYQERVVLAGTASDNVAVASVRYERDGQPVGALLLNQGAFHADVVLHAGTNTFRVIATDTSGNSGYAETSVVWRPARVLRVVSSESVHEGRIVDVALVLENEVAVGGMNIALEFNPEAFRYVNLAWDSSLDAATRQINSDVPGSIRANFAFASGGLPAGTNVLLVAQLRAHVPGDAVPLNARILDVADPSGSAVLGGNVVAPASINIAARRIKGDNNGNDRLDPGDATLIQRLLIGLDPVTTWDASANDLNDSGGLETGDVVKVLRAVVGLDPQPGLNSIASGTDTGASVSLGARTGAGLAGEGSVTTTIGNPVGPVVPYIPPVEPTFVADAAMEADHISLNAGDIVQVKVYYRHLSRSIGGADFALEYPGDALTLVDTTGVQPGTGVAPGAAVVWNVGAAGPAGGGETSRVSFAASSASAWAPSGVTGQSHIATFTFQLRADAPRGGSSIALRLIAPEASTDDGFDFIALPSVPIYLNPGQPTILPGVELTTGKGMTFSFTGDASSSYSVDVSTDLVHWAFLQTVICGTNGTAAVVDSAAVPASAPMRFYRIRR